MARLLIVHHTASPALHSLFEAVLSGAGDPQLSGAGLEVCSRPALGATPSDALAADGYILGTPANLGSMAGALKHFFDTVYYPCLDITAGRPFGLYVHGNNDTAGAINDITKIITGLRWRQCTATVSVLGQPDRGALDACWNLGATVGAHIVAG